MNELKDLYRQYSDIISRGDNVALESMLDDNVEFRLWQKYAVGKKNVLLLTGAIFSHQANNGIVFKDRSMTLYQDKNTIIAEIEYQGFIKSENNIIKFTETDFVTFNDNHKVISVRTYQRAGFNTDNIWFEPETTFGMDQMTDYKKLCKEYFLAWSDKDLTKLENMFDDQVKLRDWTLTAFGKEETLKANKNIFDNVDTCKALPLHMYQDGQTVACRLNIYINKDSGFEVVDLITFDSKGKIVEILAFKG